MVLNFGGNLFPRRGEILTNYNWIELLSNQGYGIFYLSAGKDTTATTTYFITNAIVESYPEKSTESAGAENVADYVIKLDHDHDLLVNTPTTINGKVIISLALYTTYTSDQFNAYWQVKIRKWDGTTETELGSAKTENVINVGNATRRRSFEIDINSAKFKKGEYIRITVEAYVAYSANAGSQIGYWHDPSSRTKIGTVTSNYVGEKTDAKIFIPFKVKS